MVISNPDRRRSRRGDTEPSPVKALAMASSIPVSDRPLDILEARCDLGIVVAYGRLIKPDVLDHVPMVNIHFSLLPRWRGAAPVERAILAGDEVTGVCLMRLEAGLDTGPVYARSATVIEANEHVDALRERLGEIGNELLLDALSRGTSAWANAEPQTGEATYAKKLTTQDLHLDFTQPAVIAHRQIRVGRAWTTFRGRRFLVHDARVVADAYAPARADRSLRDGEIVDDFVVTPHGMLQLLVVQPEGRPRMEMRAWRIGAALQSGEGFAL